MPEPCNSESLEIIKWSGWILSLVLGLIGIYVTFIVLRARIRHAEKLAHRKERYDAIDLAVKACIEFEDKVLDFWTAKDSKYTRAHIIISQQRLLFSLQQLARVNNIDPPYAEFAELRKCATTDIGETRRPISANSDRIVKISISTTRIQNLTMFRKTHI